MLTRLAALTAAALLAATTLVAAAPIPASAVSAAAVQGYLAEQGPIQRSGFWGSAPTITDRQILSIGYTVCGLYRQGYRGLDLLEQMITYRPDPGTEPYRVGMDGMRDAIRYLC